MVWTLYFMAVVFTTSRYLVLLSLFLDDAMRTYIGLEKNTHKKPASLIVRRSPAANFDRRSDDPLCGFVDRTVGRYFVCIAESSRVKPRTRMV